MRRLMLILLVAGCSKGPQADLQYISEARSAAAEWALVNEQAQRGQLTGPFVRTMRQSLREQVEASRRALTQPQSPYAMIMDAIIGEPDDAPPQELRFQTARLKQIEDALESA